MIIESKNEKIDLNNNLINVQKNCTLIGDVKLGNETKVLHYSLIKDSVIGNDTVITNSVIEDSLIGNDCKIGPYTHIRPGSKIHDNVKLGNFVEIKNSIVKSGTKISHLAYVGDAEIGENCNIGCGVIFANYNGKEKNKIVIGNNCFIGSNCNLIAPLNIADNTYICAGTTVTKDTKEYDFVIGRAYETVKPNRAQKYLKEK